MGVDISNKISIYNIQDIEETNINTIINTINTIINNDDNTSRCVEQLDIWGDGEFTWHNEEEFMNNLSTQFPKLIFAVDSNYDYGDSFGRIYYSNGKSHSASVAIAYEEFNENKLK